MFPSLMDFLSSVSGKDLRYVRGLIMGTPGTNVVLAIQPQGSSRISTLKLLRRAATALSVQPQAPPSLRHQHLDLAKSLRQASDSDDIRHATLSPTAASGAKSKPPAERPKPFAVSSLPSPSTLSSLGGGGAAARDDLERIVEQRARALVQVDSHAEPRQTGDGRPFRVRAGRARHPPSAIIMPVSPPTRSRPRPG